MSSPQKFQGWLGLDANSVNGQMKWGEFEPKKWEESDVDIRVSHCGICGSDLHTLRSGWGETPFPCVVGHEIVGKAVRVGKDVKHIKVGDNVGVGAQGRSCLEKDCPECSAGLESYCGRVNVGTYGGIHPNDIGKSYGGYATYNRSNGHFVFKIPDSIKPEHAAPMLCGGITVYSPLKRYGAGPGKTVGIVGVGGLGHFGVLFAKALGADRIVALSRKSDKRADAMALGADEYIATDEDADWPAKHARTVDLIVSTISSDKMPMADYLKLLTVHGTLVQVGAPDGGNLPPINAFALIGSGIQVGGSLIGAPDEIREMLQLAADKKIKPWVQLRPMKDANAAVVDLANGDARYRYVLEA
ncbi:zinc-binding protein alcohol dehydrogenase [Sporothrix schenckii 1099-18]|uniref:alcohol dehydrogenase (NADP(+)) n=2 Tax=Sporothrix schenckii TaxID=29908 RepID=U7PR90_SPOS1|nr:zinc-binding protein alcohol dehydrogenase [Sporothrix schenckii 1099-18]ERS98112.1 hypothetical protein HMPREF1624_04891 [Sporothrix schenckii ATCC 58251]KJR89802.1 zinc-binding protein alcohol dehydrogenase [Sporothrix schenckii 1099-18]